MKSFTISALVCVIIVIISSPVLTATDLPTLSLNGDSNSTQNLTIGSQVEIICTDNPTFDLSYLQVQRDGSSIELLPNPTDNRIKTSINITCGDNADFRCRSVKSGTNRYSATIRINTPPCPPTPAVTEPVVHIKQSSAYNTHGSDVTIKGNPRLTFTGMKVTSEGPVNLPIGVFLQTVPRGFRLYFKNYTVIEYGTYLIKAENIHGEFTTNLTYRGLIANPTNLKAWSTSPNSLHLKFRAGETFDVKVSYTIFYWIDDETLPKKHYVTDLGDTITVTLNSLDPGITYNIYVQAKHPKYGYSLYSNAVTVTTIKQGDSPQQEPVPPSTSPASTTSTTTSSTASGGGSEGLGFGAGIGIGLAVGILVAIAAAILAVVCFKRINSNHVAISVSTKTRVTDTSLPRYLPQQGNAYENGPETNDNYDTLRHTDDGSHYLHVME